MSRILNVITQIDKSLAEGSNQNLSVQDLATISDEALDKVYGYGRSTPGNTFGWQANLMSAAYAKKMIDAGVTDIEKISDAIHKGWNVTAQKFVQNPDQFDDTEKLRQAGKLEAKLQQRAKLMKINYAQLDDEEQEKDRVVARALLQAIKGQQGVAEGWFFKSPEEKAKKAEQHKLNVERKNNSIKFLNSISKNGSFDVENWGDVDVDKLLQYINNNGLIDVDQFAYDTARELDFISRVGSTGHYEELLADFANKINVKISNNLRQGVSEGDSGAKYRIKQIGKANKGHYYISPSTGKKVYKQAKVGDHENPKTGEHMKKIKEDETMQFAAEVTPKVSPYAGIKDNKFRGAIGEESNYNPVGVQPGGWRKYKLKVNELKELGKDKKEKIAKFRKQIQDLKAKGFYKAADDVQKGFKTVFPDEKVVAETYEYLLYRYSDLLDKHDDMFVISTIISESKHEDKKDNAKKVIKKLENTSEGQIYSTGGGAGEAQRKYKPKLSGVSEGINTAKKSINK